MLFGFDDNDQQPQRAPDEVSTPPAIAVPTASNKWLYATIGLLTGLVIALGATALLLNSDDSISEADVNQSIEEALASADTQSVGAVEVYNQIAPSVVLIEVQNGFDDSGDTNSDRPQIGAGVVINQQGQVITANHVVTGSTAIEVYFPDGTSSLAEVISVDEAQDIAVLEARSGGATIVPAVMGNSRTLRIGDPIYAVGNPLGLTASISAGVISGLDRNIPFPGNEDAAFEGLIQFDAAVNQGSSGGPLLNAEGQVIGIITALADPAGQGFFVGIGFAVPIDIATSTAADGPSQ